MKKVKKMRQPHKIQRREKYMGKRQKRLLL